MVDNAMFYLIGTLYPLVARATYPTLGFAQYAGEVATAQDADDAMKAKAQQEATEALAEPLEVYNTFFLAGRPFIGGDKVHRRHPPGRDARVPARHRLPVPAVGERLHGSRRVRARRRLQRAGRRRPRLRRAGQGRLSGMSLADGTVATRLPTQDLDRARRFYAEKLGLEPVEERPGGLLYRCGGKEFALYSSTGAAPGTFTQMGWSVDDLDATMAELQARGLEFADEFGTVVVEGNYPSKGGRGERAAWFRDSEGNLLGIGQSL